MSEFVFSGKHEHPYPHCTCAGCEGARLGAKLGKQLANDFVRIMKEHDLTITIKRKRKHP